MTTSELVKSTYSTSDGGNCVEVGRQADRVAVRDTKQAGHGPVLTATPKAWQRFLTPASRPSNSRPAMATGTEARPSSQEPPPPTVGALRYPCPRPAPA